MTGKVIKERNMPQDLATALRAVERAVQRLYGGDGDKLVALAVSICWQGPDTDYLKADTMLMGEKSPDALFAMIDQLGHAFGAEVQLADMRVEAVH